MLTAFCLCRGGWALGELLWGYHSRSATCVKTSKEDYAVVLGPLSASDAA